MSFREKAWVSPVRWAAERHLFLLLAALFVYGTLSTGYTWRFQPAYLKNTDYFAMQGEAFAHGRLFLSLSSPTLDMSPYGGRIYLYWGPVNSLLSLVSRSITGDDPGMLVRSLLYLLLGAALFGHAMERLRRRYWPATPHWLMSLFFATLLFGSPVAYLGARGGSFHAESILLSFCCQMLTISAWLGFISHGSWRMALVFGLGAALAVGTRLTNLFLLPGLAAATLLPRPAAPLRKLAVPACAVGVALAGMMVLNQARFGSPLETGFRYQEGMQAFRARLYEKNAVLSLRWVPLNLQLYFLQVPRTGAWVKELSYPYEVSPPAAVADFFPAGEALSVDTQSVFLLTPLLFLAALLPRSRSKDAEAGRVLAGIALAAGAVVLFLLCYAWSGRRFTADFVPPMLLIAFAGAASWLGGHAQHTARLRDVSLFLTAWSIAIHFPSMLSGGRKALSMRLLTEDAPLPSPLWRAVLYGVVTAACIIEIYAVAQRTERMAGKGKSSGVM